MAARYKAWTLFSHSNAGIVGSNSTQSIDVCMSLFCVYVEALRRADHSSKDSYRPCKKEKNLRNWRRGQGPAKGSRAIDEWMN
jgi:hypothetical protein